MGEVERGPAAIRLDVAEHPLELEDPGPLNPELIENLEALGYTQ